MTITTKSYDDAVYKLVPVEPSKEMSHGAVKDAPLIIRQHYVCNGTYTGTVSSLDSAMFADCYKTMLAAVPDDLPGVVTHSGEPVAYLIDMSNPVKWGALKKVVVDKPSPDRGEFKELYTHADPAEVAALRQQVKELEKRLEFDSAHPQWDGIAARDETIKALESRIAWSDAEKEVLVRAADALGDLGAPHNASELNALIWGGLPQPVQANKATLQTAHTMEQDFQHFLTYKGWTRLGPNLKDMLRAAFEAAWSPVVA